MYSSKPSITKIGNRFISIIKATKPTHTHTHTILTTYPSHIAMRCARFRTGNMLSFNVHFGWVINNIDFANTQIKFHNWLAPATIWFGLMTFNFVYRLFWLSTKFIDWFSLLLLMCDFVDFHPYVRRCLISVYAVHRTESARAYHNSKIEAKT